MGEIYALICALLWSCAVILFKKSGETISPYSLNLFRVSISSVLFTITLLVLRQPFITGAPLTDYLILFASGIFAIAVSDTLFHMSLNIVGAGITAIVDCLYSPFIVLTAYLMIAERLGPWQFAGMALIILGVFVAARHEPPPGITPRRLVIGVLYGVLAMATLAFGIVIAKPVLNRSPVMWATAMRQFGTLAALLPVALISRRRRTIFSVFKPHRAWRFSLSGTLMGSYLSLVFWIAGMKYTLAGIAAIINQTSTIFIIIFATIFLKERFTRRKAAAAALAVAGILMVTMG
ncbi:MAG: DMT family transporter [bacterium]|nr:MAG: DMT family transporter [bacterium]